MTFRFNRCANCGIEARLHSRPNCPHLPPQYFERGADGKPQTVLPGAERASDATMAQRQANAPLKPKAAQRPCDDGLFSDQRNQQELF